MKKIIRIGLLSTVGLCNLTCGARPVETSEDGAVMGTTVSSGTAEGVVLEVGDQQRAQELRMIADIQSGVLPEEILELFADLPRIDVAQRSDVNAIQRMQTNLRSALETAWSSESSFYLNAFLELVAEKLDPRIMPLWVALFGEMTGDFTLETFINKISSAYNTFFADADNRITTQVNTPRDWVVLQFLGLFFDNALPNCRINLNVPGLDDLDLIKEVIVGLKESTLNILGVWGLHDDVQVDVLKAIAEIRPKKAKIISTTPNVAFLKSFIESLTHPDLQTFVGGSKIDVMLVMDLAELNRHQSENSAGLSLHQREAALIEMFESIANLSVPNAWNIQLQVGHFESFAYGNLTPLIRAIVRSPFGVSLSLPTLVSDHVSTAHVMTKLREEFLSAESKVQVLDFEGSQLSAEGWEQLAQLAESRKPLEKIRLTGLHIPRIIVPRLGMLKSVGINMVGCGVNEADLTDMVEGWLGKGSILRGIDMRGNEVNNIIAYLLINKGFDIFLEERATPFGYLFGKP
jgi:hypothetical protein